MYEMALKRLEQQNAACLMSFRKPEILGSTGHNYALTVMVDRFSITLTTVVTGQMPFCSQPINSIHNYFVYFSFLVILVTISR
jgi:hypothetical protein